jgi:YesN/AraC family two-component response regulator
MKNPFEKKIKLLLVDDDPSMVRFLTKIINLSFGEEIELQSLSDPTMARDTIERNLIDILVTDLEMPGINGLGLLRCAKRRNALTQVLFITGHSSFDALNDALDLGATDYLLKPLDQTELVELLDQAQKRVRRWRQALAGTFNIRESQVSAAAQ